MYSGAFAYTSPPERVMLSDNTNHYTSLAANGSDVPDGVTSFSAKYTVLKFNSDTKKFNSSAVKSGSKRKNKVNVFKKCVSISKAKNLLDF